MASLMSSIVVDEPMDVPAPSYMASPSGNDCHVVVSSTNIPGAADLMRFLNGIENGFTTGAIYVFVPEVVAHRFLAHALQNGYSFHRYEVKEPGIAYLVYYKWRKTGSPVSVPPYASSCDKFGLVVLDHTAQSVLMVGEMLCGMGGPVGKPNWGCPTGPVTSSGLFLSACQHLSQEYGISVDLSEGGRYLCSYMKERAKYGVMQDRLEILCLKAASTAVPKGSKSRWVPLWLISNCALNGKRADQYIYYTEGNEWSVFIAAHVTWIVNATSKQGMRITRTDDGVTCIE